ncbi:MAG: hypothetical protein FJ143_11235 [Deltaproteobacteria bacterium]|nr:hypothetical protein [Deltaproteobacteria bacterium]
MSIQDADRVLTFREWIEAAKISDATGRRILKGPDGPPVIELSPRRIGIRVSDHRKWLEARTRAKAAA